MSLTFNESTHRYRLDKKPVPSVTGLLSKGLPKDALQYWSARTVAEHVADNIDEVLTLIATASRDAVVAELKGVPWAKRDKAALRGTDVHALAERVVHGEEVEVAPEYVGHVQGFADWIDTFGVVPVLTEHSVANRCHWYAGRFDLIADVGSTRWLFDIKTSSSVYPDTALQLAAYRGAEFYVSDPDPDTEHPMPEIDRVGVLHVTEDGTVLYPMDGGEDVWASWLAVLDVAKRRKAIDAYRHDPIYTPDELETL